MAKQIKWDDFTITPIKGSVRKEEINDEIYFSKAYSNYISNSRLKLINPIEEGSPIAYREKKFTAKTQALSLGSAVHELYLQGDSFTLVEGLNKPPAKLGEVVEVVKKYRKAGCPIFDSIHKAATEVGYYANTLNGNRIKNVIQKGFFYYWNSQELGPEHITLTDNDTSIVKACLKSLQENPRANVLINGLDWAGDPTESHNEDALFMDVEIKYKGLKVRLPLKMKADNWTIDVEERSLTLNDLKTSGKPITWFMNPEYGSFSKFHYNRQFAENKTRRLI